MADPSLERDPLEVLAAEYTDRLRQGEQPDLEGYVVRHPDLAGEIRELFPTIAATERLKAHRARSSGGRATLGPGRPERLGDFRLVRELGRGGMGVVFEAEQQSLGRRVAVKVLPPQVLLDEKHLQRFQREARIAANLHHTNIVEVFGVGEQDGFHYYVMQLVEGVGLDTVIRVLAELLGEAKSPASPAGAHLLPEAAARRLLGAERERGAGARLSGHYWQSVARIGLQAAAALDYAHTHAVLHRDVKPGNLLLGAEGTVWLADFGLAKAAHGFEASLTRDLVGTLRYMAPEQFSGQADQRSDIYSLGLTLYELLILRPAYPETDHQRLIRRIAEGPPAPPSGVRAGIPRDLETIVLKAASHDPNHRYATAAELAEDLRCFLEDRPVRARRIGPVERLGRWCRRNPAVATLGGVASVLLVLVALVASFGYVRTTRALRGEAAARARAETNARVAEEALDRIFARFSPLRMRMLWPAAAEGAIEIPTAPMLSREGAALLEELLPFYDRLAQQPGGDARLRAIRAQATRRIGAIRQRLGQLDLAVEAYRKALAWYEPARDDSPRTPATLLEISQIENELGRLYTLTQQPAKAREAHLAALSSLEGMSQAPNAPMDARFELARTHYFLGTQVRPLPAADPRQGTGPAPLPEAQREHLTKAVSLLSALGAPAEANPDHAHLLALCYLEGARVNGPRGSGSREGADRAVEILESLVRAHPEIPDYASDLSEAYARIHIPRPPISPEAQNRILERLNKALALLDTLAGHYPEVPEFPAAKARIHDQWGAFHRQGERWAEAEQEFSRAIELQSPLVKRFPDATAYALWLATFRIAHADALTRRSQPAQARAELEETISTLQRQLESHPGLARPRELLALGYSRLAVALRQLGQRAQAAEAARHAEQEKADPGSAE